MARNRQTHLLFGDLTKYKLCQILGNTAINVTLITVIQRFYHNLQLKVIIKSFPKVL